MSLLPSTLPALQRNYEAIVNKILSAEKKEKEKEDGRVKLILVTQYRPCLAMDEGFYGVYQAMETLPGYGTSVQKIDRLFPAVYEPILALARRLRLPIIDLANSFDIHDNSLYECQIEPSTKGGELIARMIHHVQTTFDFQDGVSTFYSLHPSQHAATLRLAPAAAGLESAAAAAAVFAAAVQARPNDDDTHSAPWAITL